ncbi:hypothetical protein MLD38_036771 [Melastoma candidum]|uniref:Uncharacterized protein n=1 Tax=Melastoma candidum TaxID=119954 RepID=A0ACB9LLX6_9MYRT|nr:hypothetical protein MLD38_036771 [Melastoma candidum]
MLHPQSATMEVEWMVELVLGRFPPLYEKGEPNSNSSYGLSPNFNPNLGYVNESSPLYSGILGRPANNGPIGHLRGNPLLSLARGSLWGNGSFGFSANSGTLSGSRNDNSWMDPYDSIGNLWASSSSLSD